MSGDETTDPGDESDDWRDEFTCESCRAWTGKPPMRIRDVQTEVLKRFPGAEYKVEHGCHFRKGRDGAILHIPTTTLDLDGQSFEWLPEVPR